LSGARARSAALLRLAGERPPAAVADRLGHRPAEGAVSLYAMVMSADRVGWAKRSVPTIVTTDSQMVGTAQKRLCPPNAVRFASVTRASLHSQHLCDRAQVLPGHPLVGRRAQEVGGVECRQRPDRARAGVVVEPFAAGAHDALAGA